MSYRDRQRVLDILAAVEVIHAHLQRGGLSDGLVFDAVRIRLLEIGEAVKTLPADLLPPSTTTYPSWNRPSGAWRASSPTRTWTMPGAISEAE